MFSFGSRRVMPGAMIVRRAFRDRYPGPWWAFDEAHHNYFVVVCGSGEPMVHITYRDAGPEWRMAPVWAFSKAEARTLAAQIVKLGSEPMERDLYDARQLELKLPEPAQTKKAP